ncbi:MAG: 2-amino-4-hydroxy-6-hydroxymethyldihydropteridine diphosphokinase [Actinomycetia bacterium]|nr:2-amino-4-hydroxy-6-hydroxymethyldihydropteridine diphosphokinase [Actinomycetes bacterium]
MSDRIEVTGIRARGFHGVFEHEKRDGQDFFVDIALELDLAPAGASDDLTETVHYGEVAALVVARVEGEPFDLIERLASVIADDVLATEAARLRLEAVTVTVHKPSAPVGVPFDDVTVRVRRERPAVPVVIAIGANLGDRAAALTTATQRLADRALTGAVHVGECVETDPVGGPDQPDYLNTVVTGHTRLSPTLLLKTLHEIEAEAARTREIRWGPRTLDLDLIQYGDPRTGTDITSRSAALMLPHPRAHERGFVLVPWASADPEAVLRVGEQVVPVRELMTSVDTTGVRPATPPC